MTTKLPPAALEAIPDDTRWAIANALRAAAERWEAWAANRRLAEQFAHQAAEARELAEQFENS